MGTKETAKCSSHSVRCQQIMLKQQQKIPRDRNTQILLRDIGISIKELAKRFEVVTPGKRELW